MTVDEQQATISSYKIDELIEDEDSDERDHVKELELTIANLTRHFPTEELAIDLSPSIPIKSLDPSNGSFPLEMDSPLEDQCSQQPSSHSISIATPMNNNNHHHRNSLSRSSGVKEHLTDLLIPATSKSHSPLQRTLSTHSKKVSQQ